LRAEEAGSFFEQRQFQTFEFMEISANGGGFTGPQAFD